MAKRIYYKLKKDIVIKAGTLFSAAPSKIEMDPNCFISTILGLSKDTYGEILYEMGPGLDPEEAKQLEEWFERKEFHGKKSRPKRSKS